MKRNKMLLTNQIYSTLMGEAVTMVVTEAFLNSLPFNKRALSYESEGLARYCSNVVRKMHPDTLIDRAIESTSDPMKIDYLQTLKDEISAVVEAATTRIVNSECLGTASTPEILRTAALEDKELNKLVIASKKAGSDAVGEIVKKKLLDTIRDERESFERSEKLNREVRDVIKDEAQELRDSLAEDDEAGTTGTSYSVVDDVEVSAPEEAPVTTDESEKPEESLDSYLKIVLSSTDPRHPVTVFSRLQDLCMENLLYSNESVHGEVPYDTLEKITLESTFPFFDLSQRSLLDDVRALHISMEAALECENMDPEEKAQKIKKIAKTSMICSICILTLMEVLKTMNLRSPDMDMVKKFVTQNVNVQNASDDDIERIEKRVDDAADDVRKSVALGALSADDTAIAKESLVKVREILESTTVPAAKESVKNRIIGKLTSAIESTLQDPDRIIRTDPTSVRIREDNIAALEHAIRLLTRRVDVDSVNICIESTTQMGEDNNSVMLKATGLDRRGTPTMEHFFEFNTAKFLGDNLADALRDCAGYCDIKVGHKPLNIYFADQGYAVPLCK
jgi:hypothetical protein